MTDYIIEKLTPFIEEYILVGKEIKELDDKTLQAYSKNPIKLKELWSKQVDIETSILDELHKAVK